MYARYSTVAGCLALKDVHSINRGSLASSPYELNMAGKDRGASDAHVFSVTTVTCDHVSGRAFSSRTKAF
jgi:hypothetical protein